MIFRSLDGKILIINKKDFVNDIIYYKKIFDTKKKFSKDNSINKNDSYTYSKIIINKYI
jgi:hypothetical protein